MPEYPHLWPDYDSAPERELIERLRGELSEASSIVPAGGLQPDYGALIARVGDIITTEYERSRREELPEPRQELLDTAAFEIYPAIRRAN
jgi:hypothetical protein